MLTFKIISTNISSMFGKSQSAYFGVSIGHINDNAAEKSVVLFGTDLSGLPVQIEYKIENAEKRKAFVNALIQAISERSLTEPTILAQVFDDSSIDEFIKNGWSSFI